MRIRSQDVFGLDQEVAIPSSDRAVEQAILRALKGIRFGSVEIIVHDSKVVQIERKEKMRMDRL
ncbi:YezD family protein [Nitrospira sp. BLG_2]|uniref:YezD family protein n=1 Tax=Nitrospira sp. BLG_2 TaxID=3397507 RepID=UPI003B9C21B0